MPDLNLTNEINIEENSPYNFHSKNPISDIDNFLSKSITNVNTASSPRIIVIETWLMLDYAIRQLIIWGIGADLNSNEDFDLRNELLPIGFKSRLDFLIKFKKRQEILPADPDEKCLKLPLRFWRHISKDLGENEKIIMLKTIYDYQKGINPKYLTPEERETELNKVILNPTAVSKETQTKQTHFRTVDEHWLNLTSHLTETWIKGANQVNNARNKAAHSYNEEDIFVCFGIYGQNKTEELRKKCIRSIDLLLKVKI